MNKEIEHYIEHEVRLRVNDEKFKSHEKRFDALEAKLNWIITLVISGILIPIVLHGLKLISNQAADLV